MNKIYLHGWVSTKYLKLTGANSNVLPFSLSFLVNSKNRPQIVSKFGNIKCVAFGDVAVKFYNKAIEDSNSNVKVLVEGKLSEEIYNDKRNLVILVSNIDIIE